eukprot:11104-Heterococcus_DN1.PRE.1
MEQSSSLHWAQPVLTLVLATECRRYNIQHQLASYCQFLHRVAAISLLLLSDIQKCGAHGWIDGYSSVIFNTF